jgi:lipopolysaccharide transport system ATP-binding protein
MSDTVITVENLSKKYLLGHRSGDRGHNTLRDVITREARNFARKAIDVLQGREVVQGDEVEEFWALKNVSFEVKQGETIGIIGRNGAGKSTLFKILSRITEPTEGRVSIRGKVSSLLEVGTGFHPELTGRENVFLNGAVLGMTQREIHKKFDEIVSFAEVEKFLDTPVKRYSSGMYVRLAFAVAAHLEPDILIVDEVLAVGDSEFQKKCLGKMDDVSRREGRTVLFVSHNMEAILKLCKQAILLRSGEVAIAGEAKTVFSEYVAERTLRESAVDLKSMARAHGLPREAMLVKAVSIPSNQSWSFSFGQQIQFDLWVSSAVEVDDIELGIGLFSFRGFEVASWTNTYSGTRLKIPAGLNAFRIRYDDLALLPGQYHLGIGLRSKEGVEDYLPEAVSFEVLVSAHSVQANMQSFGGVLVPRVSVSNIELSSCCSELTARLQTCEGFNAS